MHFCNQKQEVGNIVWIKKTKTKKKHQEGLTFTRTAVINI